MSRDQRASGPLLGRGTKAIGSLIGAGREAYAHHKEKSAQEKQLQAQQAQQAQQTQQAQPTDHDSQDEDDDEEDWALDEASTDLDPTEHTHHTTLIDTSGLETPPANLHPLPIPVILPQRRPQTKSRGFVRAYAPILGETKGISQETFLKFLDEFYAQTQTSTALTAINVAGNVVGMVPSVITMAIATASNIATNAAIAGQSRYKTNTYLDQINAKLFNPRNLHCVVMTYSPSNTSKFVDVDIAVNTAVTKSMAHASKLGKMSNSAGTSKGEFAIPNAAPLIYPTIDNAAFAASENGQPLPESKQSAMKRSSAFLKDYLDRRAAAEYAGTYGPDSKLAVSGATEPQKFASRYSDPNHPANSGSIFALLTGGAFDPRAKVLGRRAEMRSKITRQGMTEQDKRNVAMGRGGTGDKKGLRGMVRKVMAEDVLYLLIAEIPSQQEMGRLWEAEQGRN